MLSMTKDWRAWHRNFYNSSELIVPATDIINKAAKDMKTDISDLFKTFREVQYDRWVTDDIDDTFIFRSISGRSEPLKMIVKSPRES